LRPEHADAPPRSKTADLLGMSTKSITADLKANKPEGAPELSDATRSSRG
jgi:hypothetical protein